MRYFTNLLMLVISTTLIVGCETEPRSTGSGSSATYDYSVTSNEPTPPASGPDTTAQDAIDRANQQMANDAANAAAQQQFLAGMAAAQETMNNANNNQATSNW